MGRLIALLLAGFALALGVAACGGDDASKGPDQAATGPQTVRAEDGTWTCRDFTGPRGKGKKCSNGDRFFTAERTDLEP